MNCQEVTEYMQRQLDHDLNGEETEILMTHTRQCPECAAMMERLQLLNEGLENLPKVTPSYSLVDAILPRLAELDVSGEGAEDEVKVEPANVIPFDGATKSGSGKRKWTERYTVGAFAGVAAAAVVIVFILFNYSSNPLRGGSDDNAAVADSAAANSTNMSTSDNAADTSAIEQKTLMTESTDSAADSSSSDTSSNKSASSNAVKKSADPQALNVDPDGEIMPPLATGDSAKDAPAAGANAPNVEVSGSDDTADAGSDSKADGGTSADSTAAANDLTTKASNTKAGDSKAADDSAASNNGINKETGGTIAMTDTTKDDRNANQNFTNNTVIASPISPNGQYQAFIVEDRIEIYTVQDSALVFQGNKRIGIANLKWSQDSKELTYETSGEGGAKKVFAIEMKSASEQQQSSNK